MGRIPKLATGLVAFVAMIGLCSSAFAEEAPLGKRLFHKRCGACHTAVAGDNRVGPSLFGLIGRTSGQVAGFDYSFNNRKDKVVWTAEVLETYIADPTHVVPGTKMTVFRGVKDPSERAAIVEYLEQQK